MKIFVLIFLTWGSILAQPTRISENIEKKSELELIKKNLTQGAFTKDVDTKVKEHKFKESELEVTKIEESKLERSKDLEKDELKLKDESKLQDELKVKTELKLKDESVLKDNLKLEKVCDSKSVDRAKKSCQTVAGPNASPTKICFEVTPGVQGQLEVCKEDGSKFSNPQQIPQESQLGPQIPQESQPDPQIPQKYQKSQEPQQIPQPDQINYEIPQQNYQFPQPNYREPQPPVFYNGPPQPSAQIPVNWCIQTEAGQQNFPSVIQIQQQSPQAPIDQTQHRQQFVYSQNIPSAYSQNPSRYPVNVFSGYSPNIYPSYPQNQPSGYYQSPSFVYPQKPPTGYSQNPPTGYSQNPPNGYSQNPPTGYSQYPPSGYSQYPPSGYSPNPPSGYPQNPPSVYPQNPPSSYPQQPNPGYPQNCPCYCYNNYPSVYPQNYQPAFQIPPQPLQESFSQVQPQQQFGYSQNLPSSFPQNIFSSIPQNPPNYPSLVHPGYNPKFEIVQPDSQGFLPTRGNQSGNQGGVQPSAFESSGGYFVQPTGAIPTAEGNSQNIQQQTPQNAMYLDARRIQPGPLSRILDRPPSFQMSGRAGTMESSRSPLMIQEPRFSREPKSGSIQYGNTLKSELKFQPQPFGKGERSPFRIQL